MNTTTPTVFFFTLDEATPANVSVVAKRNDVIAFCAGGLLMNAEYEFAPGHFSDVPESWRRLVATGKLGGAQLQKWSTCINPDDKARISIKLLVEETGCGGLYHRSVNVTVLPSKDETHQQEPSNTLIDLDEALANSDLTKTITALSTHPFNKHVVFSRKYSADQSLSFEVQDIAGMCDAPLFPPPEEERSQVIAYFPKTRGYLQFAVTVYEQSPNNKRRLRKKFSIQALTI